MPNAPVTLAGLTCLVTGASRGLGEKLATASWEAGASVLLVARSERALGEVIARLPPRPGQTASAIAADLADPGAAERIVLAARARVARLDVLVNNAAIQGPIGPAHTNDAEGWRATLQINLLSAVELCRRCVPWMAERGGGRIVNLSGGGATGPRPGFSAYATAKAGLVRFSETLAEEVRALAVEVNCVAPGVMRTALLEEVVRAGAAAAGAREVEQAAKALSAPEDASDRAAALCLFLSSAASRGITGKLLSAVWDPWEELTGRIDELRTTDIYTLRRIVPKDRGRPWGDRP